MPWCMQCKEEYRDGIEKCARCGSALVSMPEPEEAVFVAEGVNWAFLMNAADESEADLIESVLSMEKIPVLRKYKEAGEYMEIYMGMTRFGIDIFVPEGQREVAKDILEAEPEPEEMPEEMPPDDGARVQKKYETRRRGIAWAILLYILAPVLVAVVLSYIFIK